MEEHTDTMESWERLRELCASGDRVGLEEYIATLPSGEMARALSRLDVAERTTFFGLIEPAGAANIIEELPDEQGAAVLRELDPADAAAIVDEIDSDERADVLSELRDHEVDAILTQMDAGEAQEARQLMGYDPDTAGGLMITEFLRYYENQTVSDVLDDMRGNAEKYAEYSVQYLYVVSPEDQLVGVVPLRGIVLQAGTKKLGGIMLRDPMSVAHDTPLHELEQLFDRHHFFGFPVLDADGRLVGVVKHDDVEERIGERAQTTLMRLSGIVGGEEFRGMPFRTRSMRRLSFLIVNIFLNVLAASVIALFTDTLEAVIALAVFLPIISDMGGNSGSQAIGVSIRELSLGMIKTRDYGIVLWKEATVGLMNGAVLGIIVAVVGALYVGLTGMITDPGTAALFGFIVGFAMMLNTLLSVVVGGTMPLFLKRIGIDPALASVSILTTITDIGGFFLVLGMAALLLV